MFSVEDVKKLAELSRIELSQKEMEKLSDELSKIVGFVDQIQKAPTSHDAKTPELRNVLREDGEPYERGVFSEKLLEAAPSREGNFIKVKKIISRS